MKNITEKDVNKIKLIERAKKLSTSLTSTYLELADVVAEINIICTSKEFTTICELIKIGRRVGYYMVAISKARKTLNIKKEELLKIGYIKLYLLLTNNLLGSGKSKDREWIKIACAHNVHELRAIIKGECGDITTVAFHLNQQQLILLTNLLREHGATIKGKRVLGKEQALDSIMEALG